MRKFEDAKVVGAAAYKKADKKLYEIFYSCLRDEKFYFIDKHKLYDQILTLEKAIWLPEAKNLQSISSSGDRPEITATHIVHTATHVMFHKKYPGTGKAFPLSMLLGEAVATTIDFYFGTKLYRQNKNLEILDKYPLVNMTSFIEERTDLEIFKQLIKTHYFVSSQVLKLLGSDIKLSESAPLISLSRKLDKLEMLPTLITNDFGNFALFVAHHAGHKSNSKDQKNVKSFMQRLEAASTIEEILF